MSQPASIAGVPAVDNPHLPAAQGGAASVLEYTFDVAGAKARLENLKRFFKEVMVESDDGTGDYGVLPGTKARALYKAGAEKLCEFYRLIQRPTVTHRREDWDAAFFHYEAQMDLLSRDTGQVMGTGLGSCNSMESRYRWRTARLKCPTCETEAIIKGREEYGGGWVCLEKKGGCKAKFKDDDTRITEQKLGQVENDDVYTLVNTILKMSKKRALVDAVVSITRSAGLLVEAAEEDDDEKPRGKAGKRGAATSGSKAEEVVVDTVSEDEQKALNAAATKSGHKWADVIAYTKIAHDGIDLSKTRVPKAIYAALLERVSKPEPLIPAGTQQELGK